MAGKVHKANLLYRPWKLLTLLPDWRAIRLWWFRKRRDNKDDTLLLSLIDEFARDGLTFDSALNLCPELIVRPGVLTRRRPSAVEETDIAFGWELAKKMGELDVGQSVAVKERAVLAVEAIEGTDRAIARAGELCRAGGFVVVKVAKPQQDMRFDVPTVGCPDHRDHAPRRRARPGDRSRPDHPPRRGGNDCPGRSLWDHHCCSRRSCSVRGQKMNHTLRFCFLCASVSPWFTLLGEADSSGITCRKRQMRLF